LLVKLRVPTNLSCCSPSGPRCFASRSYVLPRRCRVMRNPARRLGLSKEHEAMRNWRATTAAVAAVSALALAGCSSENEQNNGGGGNGGSDLSGTLRGVGASSQQAAQEAWMAGFNQLHPDV